MRKKRILVVDDDADLLLLLKARLKSVGYEIFAVSDPRKALKTVNEVMPDLIILDILMPGFDGYAVKAKLNENPHTGAIPVIFLTGKTTIPDKVKGLSVGADDYICKPYSAEELLTRIKSVLDKRDFYEAISMTDGLTGLPNITFFKKQFALFFNIAKRYKKVFTLAIIDINNFKEINDTRGHPAGDAVLKEFASIAKSTFRKSDIVCRYGGDEFTVIMPETDAKQSAIALERLKKSINKKGFSVSAGMASYKDAFRDESEMLKLADKRFYDDKKA